MVGSVGSSTALLDAIINNATATQNIGIAVMQKSLDIEKSNGEAALQLIASAAPTVCSVGVDVYA